MDLEAIEQIKQLKARSWRAVDMKDAELLRGVLADDCVVDFRSAVGNAPNEAHLWRDPDRFCTDTMAVTQSVTTVHHGFPPEITVTSPQDAEAIWPFEDLVWVDAASADLPYRHFRGWGYYHETYRKTAAGWKIASTRISRLRLEAE